MPKSIFFENGLKWRLGRASGRYQHPFGAHLGPIWERFGHDFKHILQDRFDSKKYLRHTAYSMQQLKEPSKNSETFHKPPKTTFSFTDRQAAIDDGIVEQTSERLASNEGAAVDRRMASSM